MVHKQGLKETYVAIFTPTGKHKADMNTKSHGGVNLNSMNMTIVGHHHYHQKERNTTNYFNWGNIISAHTEDHF